MVKLKDGADKRLTKLLLNILCNVVMVKDYATALSIAKQHGLTCVTPNLQVVYAGAFITKVGQQVRDGNQSESKVALYSQIQELTVEYDRLSDEMMRIKEAQAELNQSDLEAMRTVRRCEVQLNSLSQSLTELHAAHLEINASISARTQKEAELQGEAARHERQQKVLADQIATLNKQKGSQSHGFSGQDSERLLFLNKQINTLGLQESEKLAGL